MSRSRSAAGAWTVLRKEIREALRDRNLVLQLILVPAFLYPLMGFGAYQVFLISQGAAEGKVTTVWVDTDAPEVISAPLLERSNVVVEPVPDELDHPDRAPDAAEFRAARDAWSESDGEPPAVMLSWHRDSAGSDVATIAFDSSRDQSEQSREWLEDSVVAYRDSIVLETARAVGLDRGDVELYDLDLQNTASSRELGRYILSLMLPFFLMIMLAQGCYYSSLDTVVGERERGTLETVLSSPIERSRLLQGKFLYVVISSLVAFLLNLISLTVFLTFVLRLMDVGDNLQFTVAPLNVALMVVTAVLISASLAAVMMLVCVPARSYREGQAALMPVYMVASFSGVVVLMKQGDFTVQQALIPIINVVGLLKALLAGEPPIVPMLVTFAVLAVLAVVSMRYASSLASQEGAFFDPEISLKRLMRMGGGKS